MYLRSPSEARNSYRQGWGKAFPFSGALMTSHRTGHSQCFSVYLWDYQTVKSLLLGKVLFIFGAQSMSYLEPIRGGCCSVDQGCMFTKLCSSVHGSRFPLKCLFYYLTWLKGSKTNDPHHLTLWTISLIKGFRMTFWCTCPKNLM